MTAFGGNPSDRDSHMEDTEDEPVYDFFDALPAHLTETSLDEGPLLRGLLPVATLLLLLFSTTYNCNSLLCNLDLVCSHPAHILAVQQLQVPKYRVFT